jgi:hypothetical protein
MLARELFLLAQPGKERGRGVGFFGLNGEIIVCAPACSTFHHIPCSIRTRRVS